MLSFHDVSLRRGGRLLFEHASFTVQRGDRTGLVGANGSGKSSLLGLILGNLSPDSGYLQIPPGLTIASVTQEIADLDRLALEYVLDGDKELRHLETKLQEAEQSSNGILQAELHARLDAIGGYQAKAKAARLLSGLGFANTDLEKPVKDFSGGWRMRLHLAQALMCRSDLLLLDEPTNHLDLDAVIWLQEWLKTYPGTLILISHDRDFLDQICDHTLHLEQGRIKHYTGNYSAFEKLRAQALAQQQAAYRKQQREKDQLHQFINRFRAKATKARQVQSRIKVLERLAEIAPAHVDSPFHFRLPRPKHLPFPLVRLENTRLGYDGGTTILREVNLTLGPGDRLGLLGPNGAGKSTLIKTLAGKIAPLAGNKETADQLRIGYFAQHQLEQLVSEQTALEHFQWLDRQAKEEKLRSFLGGFGFSGERATTPVDTFSGGEKARLVLALIVYQQPNLLLLDEPTNHLDIEMRHALTLALQDYPGALILVSHDRHLLRCITDEYWLVADGHAVPYSGNLEDYRRWLLEQRNRDTSSQSETPTLSRRDLRREEAKRRERLRPLKLTLAKAEKDVEQFTRAKQEIEQLLADPSLYQPEAKKRLQALLIEKAEIDKRLELAEQHWMEAEEKLHSLN